MILYEIEPFHVEAWVGWTPIDKAQLEADEVCDYCVDAEGDDACFDGHQGCQICIYNRTDIPDALARAGKLARLLGGRGPTHPASDVYASGLPDADAGIWSFLLGWRSWADPPLGQECRMFVASPHRLPWLGDDCVDDEDADEMRGIKQAAAMLYEELSFGVSPIPVTGPEATARINAAARAQGISAWALEKAANFLGLTEEQRAGIGDWTAIHGPRLVA
jgi:hypothetical protein